MFSKTSVLALLPLASAHFQVLWPESRGFSEDTIVNYPCGGYDTITNRTTFPVAGGPIQLHMEHTQTNVEVLIALGNNPSGADYHTVLVPTFFEQGPDSFCLGDVTFPASLNATAGQNATIQVQSNGDPSGGLYACIDITFGSSPLTSAQFSDHCTNSSGVHVSALNTQANANETEAGKGGSSGGSSGGQATSSSSSGIAAQATALGALAAGAVGVVGMLAL